MLAKTLHTTLHCVAGLVSVALLRNAFQSSSSGVAMAAQPIRYRHNDHYHYIYPEERPGSRQGPSEDTPTSWFVSMSEQVLTAQSNPTQLNYGIAVTDVDNDGELEIVVAGFNGPNLVLKYNHTTSQLENLAIDDAASPFYGLRDEGGQAIGVCACDVDGDGREEIYFLNTNQAYWGTKSYPDKLFKWRNGHYEDILSDSANSDVTNDFAGRSVACIDRKGTGRYSIYLANYANYQLSPPVGACAMIEMNEAESNVSEGTIKIENVASQVGVRKFIGGRGVTVGPILNDEGRSDIFCDNERGPNFLYKNNGQGVFTEVAQEHGVEDPYNNGRGVALADFNGDGKLDIVYGNWNGEHRLYLQQERQGRRRFKDAATPEFARPSPIRTVIAADMDNDGVMEVFFNNIAYRGWAPNRLFKVSPSENGQVQIEQQTELGKAVEETGHGTGGAVTDFDGDGQLELILAHGESAEEPLTVYRPRQGANNNWLRVMPLTQQGAPARGALVKVTSGDGVSQLRVIDGGSGYLCQMEPVAHFGFGVQEPTLTLEVKWPDTATFTRPLRVEERNTMIRIPHPGQTAEASQQDSSNGDQQSP
ncbi:cartilage acidic protein 1-like [Diadema setosum]|uniref:cartilage acidic protein 1-like n=1 Tax=Diadema setosum TaxID=31175 RepID=UPI003B3AEC87